MAGDRALNPPLLLAIECATARAHVALVAGDTVLAQRSSRAGQHHSESLLPMIDALLDEAKTPLGGIEAFGISIGPGAFTSLRIGLATLKGLCFSSRAPVVAVSTLEGMAVAAERQGLVGEGDIVAPLLDARRGEVYGAAYAVAPAPRSFEARVEPSLFDATSLATALPSGTQRVGEGLAVVAPAAADSPAAQLEPDAVSVAVVATRALAAGRYGEAASLVPRYVRRAEAEAKRISQAVE